MRSGKFAAAASCRAPYDGGNVLQVFENVTTRDNLCEIYQLGTELADRFDYILHPHIRSYTLINAHILWITLIPKGGSLFKSVLWLG